MGGEKEERGRGRGREREGGDGLEELAPWNWEAIDATGNVYDVNSTLVTPLCQCL